MTELKQHVTAPIQRVVWAVCSFFIFCGVARGQTLPDFSELVERSSPAVVNISTSQKRAMPFKLPKGFELPKDLDIPEDSPFYEYFQRYFGERAPCGAMASSCDGVGTTALPRGALGLAILAGRPGCRNYM